MDPADHRALAETLADRVYRDTGDPQALAHVAVVHALLATGPVDLEPVVARAARPMTVDGWVVLVLILATVVACVWLVTG